jgi:hypothetical protein
MLLGEADPQFVAGLQESHGGRVVEAPLSLGPVSELA